MCPVCAVNNMGDVLGSDSILPSESLVSDARSACSAYIPYLLFGQPSASVLFPTGGFHSMFCDSIMNVFPIRSQKQVSRVDAGWVVTAVADTESLKNGSVADGLGNTMSQSSQILGRRFTAKSKVPVTGAQFRGLPLPTLINVTDPDLGPETQQILRTQGRDSTMAFNHDRLLIRRSWSERLAGHSAGRSLMRYRTRRAA